MKSLLLGLEFCVQQGLVLLEVEMDSKVVVDIIQNRSLCQWKLDSCYRKIMAILSNHPIVILHLFPEANAVADELAKMGSSSRTLATFKVAQLPQKRKNPALLDATKFPSIGLICGTSL
ncbi:hypothetical protein ACH5RR_031963 [Cinchona calisaya]|uniref:RNase H type-1 domain-containing protein n=1 Tax=Cinchona calisaya TaxID=153742 RepID=A0ABD2YI38_9GENT